MLQMEKKRLVKKCLLILVLSAGHIPFLRTSINSTSYYSEILFIYHLTNKTSEMYRKDCISLRYHLLAILIEHNFIINCTSYLKSSELWGSHGQHGHSL